LAGARVAEVAAFTAADFAGTAFEALAGAPAGFFGAGRAGIVEFPRGASGGV
jgi:hypothetical protein